MVRIPMEIEEEKVMEVQDWVAQVNKNLQNMVNHSAEMDDSWTKRSIYKVPTRVSDLNEKAYKPQMMTLDGCFMLEIFHFATLTSDDDKGGALDGYTVNYPIFSRHGKLYMMPNIKHDMLLLENQLPMRVLEKLFSFQFGQQHKGRRKSQQSNTQFFFPYMTTSSHLGKCLHDLDLHRKSMVQNDAPKSKPQHLQQISHVGTEEVHWSAPILMQRWRRYNPVCKRAQ
ncbi:hypothetical protein RCOM_1383310 [Ricinus communis]|uniref:Uncharacterized protein n=1 Tax=Ricinus communis TaxID=3988 RepID=B9S807_RICCO|nr:hypothetical protein RCOM_1383310 [Ricinus communis]